MKKSRDPLKERLARVVLYEVLESGYLAGCLRTLGKMGSEGNVQAARVVVEVTSKFLGDAGESAAGQELLAALGKMEDTARADGDDEDDADRQVGGGQEEHDDAAAVSPEE